MKLLRILPILTLLFSMIQFAPLMGQLHIGFNGGLNTTQLSGPEEKVDGEGESLSSSSGFHISMRVSYDLNDWFAIGGAIGYMQRGVQRDYNGPSFFRFQTTDGRSEVFDGRRQQELADNTDHLDLPLFVQFSPKRRIQFYGGPYLSLTLAAKGGGRLRFTESSFQGEEPQLETGLEYDYYSDDPGIEGEMGDPRVEMAGDVVYVPELLSAYPELEELENTLYKRWHYGLQMGTNLYLSSGLYFNVEWMYGLNDMTRQEGDLSISERPNDEFSFRDDFDRFISWRFSIGFSF
ncbi:MAG: outer membrane beta-barrel protein [Bacteroidetes bacterium]|nr:outer membrane beta-barrel protein [Bacteroidota bacterium]